jgi:hypothetical protein
MILDPKDRSPDCGNHPAAHGVRRSRTPLPSTPLEGKKIIQVIDSTGEEIWYSPDNYALSLCFFLKNGPKSELLKQITIVLMLNS